MVPFMQIPMIKGDKVDSRVDYRDSLPVNAYPVLHPTKGAAGYMKQVWGVSDFGNGYGEGRGGRWVSRSPFEGQYRVSGTSFIKLEADGTSTVLGDVGGTGKVSIAYSFNNVAVVSSGTLWYYNPSDGLREITVSTLGYLIDIIWIDGVFVLTDGEDIAQSDPLDEGLYDPFDVGNAQFRPDPSYGLGLNEDNEVLVLGQKTIEYFTNQGLDSFQFVRIRTKSIKFGILGTHCKAEIEAQWACIGRREMAAPEIRLVRGGSGDKISSMEIDKILQQDYTEAELSLSTIDVVIRDGMKFVQFNLPRHTLMYNDAMREKYGIENSWFIAKSDVYGTKPYRLRNYVLDPATNKWVGDDRRGDNFGYLDDAVATHFGEIAECIIDTPLVRAGNRSASALKIETIPGYAPENDATVFLSRFNDNLILGNEHTFNYGDNLDYDQRFVTRRWGYARNHIAWRIRWASRSRMAFCNLDVTFS